MKKYAAVILIFTLFFNAFSLLVSADTTGATASPTGTPQEIAVTLNGTPIVFDVPPQIINNRTMVPVRAIFEALGYTVSWDENSKTIIAVSGVYRFMLIIGSTTAFVINLNDGSVQTNDLDSPPVIVDGRTLVPVRFIAEASGETVDWDAANLVVTITTPPPTTTQINATDGSWTIIIPAGWTNIKSSDGSYIFNGPDNTGVLSVQTIPLTAASLQNLDDLAKAQMQAEITNTTQQPNPIIENITTETINGLSFRRYSLMIDKSFNQWNITYMTIYNNTEFIFSYGTSGSTIPQAFLDTINSFDPMQ